ncbi:hypothetical protein HY490_00240 [Candidatus Woesearchaeota archaeon]|nr:hypothetical protein [Candidatus Woesearchaeota archaeon]
MPDFLQKQSKPNLDYREKIVALSQMNPVQPQSVAKALNTNSILASAMLSELAEKGTLVVSFLKVGSSPLYYLPNHPEHLLNYVQCLNEKDRQTLERLQQEIVLRDNSLEPLVRVSLRNMKDYAKQLTVKYAETQEVFWKYFLSEDQIAEQIIKKILEPEQAPQKPPADTPSSKDIPKENPKEISKAAPKATPNELNKSSERIQEHNEWQESMSEAKPTRSDAFSKIIAAYLTKKGVTILNETAVKRNAENDYLITIPTPVGKVHYYCKATNKKRVSDADISKAYVEGQLRKLPILYLHTGEFTPKAKQLLADLKGVTATKL